MKNLLLILAFVLAMPAAWGQSYDKMWKAVSDRQGKDLPKSALAEVAKIRQKALREGNDAQLLRSVLVTYQLQNDIAPDSSSACLQRMEAACAKEKKPVVRALWENALGQVYAAQWGDTAAATRAHDLLLASVKDVSLLGQTKATDWLPLFTKGEDSRYYGDDLLSVLSRRLFEGVGNLTTAEQDSLRARMLNYYKKSGRREAALLTELDIIKAHTSTGKTLDERSDYKSLCRLKEEYKDLALNVETYIQLVGISAQGDKVKNDSTLIVLAREGLARYGKEKRAAALQNYINTMQEPLLQLSSTTGIGYPGRLQSITLRARNMESLTLRVYRTALTAEDLLGNVEAKDVIGRATSVQTLEHALPVHPAYVNFSDSLSFVCAEPGIYVLRLSAPGLGDSYTFFRVTRLQPLSLCGNIGQNRVTPVDALSGRPLLKGQVKAYESTGSGSYKLTATYNADAEGNIFLPQQKGYRTRYLLSVGTDEYGPTFSPNTGAYHTENTYIRNVLNTFTDRGIYRPGQQVHFGVVAYTQVDDDITAAADLALTATLTDTNGKEVDTLHVTTDILGAAGGTFTLPETVLPGAFSITIKSSDKSKFTTSRTTVRVEEYKRPTFTVDIPEPDSAYKLGDSLRLAGKAETYTGLPLRGAKVKYTIAYGRGYYDHTKSESGETVTDDEGRFYVPVVFKADDDSDGGDYYGATGRMYCPWYLRHYAVTADVTAENGETQSADRTLYASRRSSWLAYEWETTMCRENLPKVTVWRRNSPWRNITSTGRYEIRKDSALVLEGNFTTGKAFIPAGLDKLPSGQYDVRLYCADLDTAAFAFTLMSETDTRPWGKDHMTYYVRKSEAGDSAYVMVGSIHQDVTLFYDLIAGGKVIDSKRYKIGDSIEKFSLSYKEEYGDGARAVFAFVHDGALYSQDVTVQRPVPEKKLQLHWSTFRSKLQPGQKEEWRLRITHADGTPADASLMACLYDASLDQLAANPWDFALSFRRTLPSAYYRTMSTYYLNLSLYGTAQRTSVPELTFTDWQPDLFMSNYGIMFAGRRGGIMYANARTAMKSSMVLAETDAAVPMAMKEASDEAEPVEALGNGTDAGAGEVAKTTMEPRKNFAETAFFMPALRTNKKGEVSLIFTLPESLTTWQFRALAHDGTMNYGQTDTTVVARMDFMVQPNMPRFLREGDKATLPVTLSNLTGKAVKGTARCEILDAETGAMLASLKQPFKMEKEQTLYFSYNATAGHPVLIVRTTASTGAFSDGEEHYLPVLTSREQVTRTLPFDMTAAGTKELRIDTLWQNTDGTAEKRLTVEVSSNPTWYAVAALPVVTEADCYSVTSWARRYYALTLAQYIAKHNPEIRRAAASGQSAKAWADLLNRNPELKQTLLAETPWTDEAQGEAQRTAALPKLFDETANSARRTAALDKLQQQQLAEGAWGWFKGMYPSEYITTEVCMMLARLYELTGDRDAEGMLRRAFRYLERETAKEVKQMKKDEKKYHTTFSASEQHLKYLYVRALLGKGQDADAKYLLDKFEKPEKTTMWEKAMTAVVLGRYGRKAAALTAVQSLKEHTVQRDGMGRYFDTDRALWCGESYKIPTQTAVIEALTQVTPADRTTLAEMKLWLMQARRTQGWETSRAVTDALFALLIGTADNDSVQTLSGTKPLYYTLRKGTDVLAVNAQSKAVGAETVGYFKQSYDDDRTLGADNIIIRKQNDGLAWGAVYAQYTLPAADVAEGGKGLTVKRTLEVKRGTAWQPLAEGDALTKGYRVRQVFTITADRDYDFVSLKAARAACLEPAEALSGYTSDGDVWFYRVVRDASNEYFFEQLRKGSHTLTEEMFVDRTGTYTLGTAKVQSLYAPEFTGNSSGLSVTVK